MPARNTSLARAARVAVCGVAALASCAAAQAQSETPSRVRLFASGAFAFGTEYSEARSYTLYAEESTLDADYTADGAPGFEFGIQFNLRNGLGAAVALGKTDRDGSVDVRSGLPHPFFFDQKREVSLSGEGFPYNETALHIDLVYTKRRGSLELAAFAGASRIQVETRVVESLSFSEEYPFDTATLTGLPGKTVEDSPFGFNVGGGVDYVFGRFGLGAQLRYSRATAKLVPAEGETLEVDAGGLQIAAGLRLYF
jgi:opacity protein-like surface antigen